MAWIPDVHPNELIESAWANTIRDHTVHAFANAAARDSAIPAPAVGMTCYVQDVGQFQTFTDKVTPGWQKPWGLPWGRLQEVVPPDIPSFTNSLFVPGSQIGVGPTPNRRVLVTANLYLRKANDSVGTVTVGLQRAAMERAHLVSLSPNYAASVTMRYTFVNLGGVAQLSLAVDLGACAAVQMNITADDVGPA